MSDAPGRDGTAGRNGSIFPPAMSEPTPSLCPPSPAAPWLQGGGEVGEWLRARDWSGTALGPLDTWPASLRTALHLCLALPSAALISWGPEQRMLYNDGFRRLWGEQQAHLLGEPLTGFWGPAWPALEDAYARALAGEPTSFAPQRVFIDRGRGPEETHVQGSLTPLRDERGEVRGCWNVWTPVTAQVLEERRAHVLRELAQEMARTHTLEELFATAARTLETCEHDLPFVRAYVQHAPEAPYRKVGGPDRAEGLLRTEWPRDAVPPTQRVLPREEWGAPPGDLERAVVMPILLPGEDAPVALLLAGVSPRLVLDEDYLAFYRLVASTVSAAAIHQQTYRAPWAREQRSAALMDAEHVPWPSPADLSNPSPQSFSLVDAQSPPHVLIADGDASSRETWCGLITHHGWTVEAAGDVRQALEAIRRSPPDMIVADLELPEWDGLGLLEHLRQAPRMRTVPVLLASARTGPGTRQDGLDRGAVDSLEKSCSPREFIARLQFQLVRIRMRRALRIHRHHIHELVENAPSAIAILHGPEHVFEFVNKHFRALVPSQGLLGQRVRDACPLLECQGIFEVLDEVYRTGEPFFSRNMVLSVNPGQAGRLHEVTVHYSCQPLRDLAGRVEGLVSAFIDVTDWLQSRQREEQRAAELEAIIDSIPDGVCIADSSGHVRTNRMEPGLLHSSGIEEALQDALRGETSTRDIYLPQQDTGRYRVIRSATAPVRLREAIVGAVSINMDITERKRTEEEREVLLANEQAARGDAERANRKKDEFLARVSHELATPLVGMRLWLDLLRAEPSRFEEASAALTQCIQTQSRIVHDLLDTARALSGKMSVALEACEPSEPVQAAVHDLRPLAQQKGVALEVHLGETSLVLADPKRMQQVMSNLLSNAVKFTPPGGRVDVRLMQDSSGVCIIVQDTGRGFPSDFQPMLFAPFRQEEESTTRANGGLGLGLSIVRQLVELQGGTVWAESPGRGLGATFTVWLPAQEDPPEDALPEDERGGELQLKGLRLLLVEDDGLTRTAMKALLERHGAHVEAEENATHGLATLRRGGFDALVCDIAMPGEDGLSLIRKIRALEGPCGQIPAAAFSAHMREEDRLQALMAGFQMHIPKSVETRQLIQQLQTLVNTPPVEG